MEAFRFWRVIGLHFLSVGIGGMIGSVLRYAAGLYTERLWETAFPYGTLFVNVAGCFLLGFLTGWEYGKKLPSYLAAGLGTGMIGSFTTFSAFSMDAVRLYESGSILAAAIYVVLSGVLGLSAAVLGMYMGKRIIGKDTASCK
jgi:CrcB protein